MDDNYAVCPYCGAATDVNAAAAQAAPVTENAQDEPKTEQSANYFNRQPYGQPNQFNGGYYAPQNVNNEYTPAPRPQRSAYIAAILAFTFGYFGLHNFYLDRKNRGLTQLLISLLGMIITCGLSAVAMEVWAVIEGLKLLKGEINTDGTGALIKMSF